MNEMLIAKDAEKYTQEIEKVKWKAVPLHTPSFYLPSKKEAFSSTKNLTQISEIAY